MKNIKVCLISTAILACSTVLLTMGLSFITGIELEQMTRDVTEIAGISPFSGFLSTLGMLLWSISAFVCLFVAVAVRTKTSKRIFKFLLSSAALSGWLLFDDLFLFHEALARWHLGLDEKWVMLCLVAAFAFYLLNFRKVILKTNYSFLITATTLFICSVLVDSLFPYDLTLGWLTFFEDALKWIGLCFWCLYYVDVSYQALINAYAVSVVSNDIQVEINTRAIIDENVNA